LPTWLRSNGLDLLLALLLGAVEAAAVAPWVSAASHEQYGGLTGIGILVVGLALFWTTRSGLAAGWTVGTLRALNVALWVALLLGWYAVAKRGGGMSATAFVSDLAAGQRLAVTLLITGIVIWWRATSLGASPDVFSIEHARRTVVRGLILVVLALLASAFASGSTATDLKTSVAAALPIVFVGGMVAAAAAQLRATRQRQARQGQRTLSRWLGSALALATLMFGFSIAFAAILNREAWGVIGGPLSTAARGVGTLAFWVLIAGAYIFFLALTPLIWLLRFAAGGGNDTSTDPSATGPPSFGDLQQGAEQGLPAGLRLALELGVVVAIAVAVGWFVLHGVRRYYLVQQAVGPDEDRESLWSRELLGNPLRTWRPRRIHSTRARRHDSDFSRPPADVRAAYRYLLELGDRNALQRRPSATPNDYFEVVSDHWPEQAEALADLTTRYERVRYGERDDPADVAAAQRDWASIYAHVATQHLAHPIGRERRDA
jgi:hypothetical protein